VGYLSLYPGGVYTRHASHTQVVYIPGMPLIPRMCKVYPTISRVCKVYPNSGVYASQGVYPPAGVPQGVYSCLLVYLRVCIPGFPLRVCIPEFPSQGVLFPGWERVRRFIPGLGEG